MVHDSIRCFWATWKRAASTSTAASWAAATGEPGRVRLALKRPAARGRIVKASGRGAWSISGAGPRHGPAGPRLGAFGVASELVGRAVLTLLSALPGSRRQRRAGGRHGQAGPLPGSLGRPLRPAGRDAATPAAASCVSISGISAPQPRGLAWAVGRSASAAVPASRSPAPAPAAVAP
jgi:hypothetical protein